METFYVGTDNICLAGTLHFPIFRFHIFGLEAAIEGSIKSVKVWRILVKTSETCASEIEALIAEVVKRHPVEAIDHVLVSPYTACLLFLEGRICRDHVSCAVDNGKEIALTDVMFLVDGKGRSFKVRIRKIYDEGFATIDKVGEMLQQLE